MNARSTRMLSVYDGQICIGHLLLRPKQGVEAFDADDRSLGLFADQKSAVLAIPHKENPAPAKGPMREKVGVQEGNGADV
jgi:hypothetical protein